MFRPLPASLVRLQSALTRLGSRLSRAAGMVRGAAAGYGRQRPVRLWRGNTWPALWLTILACSLLVAAALAVAQRAAAELDVARSLREAAVADTGSKTLPTSHPTVDFAVRLPKVPLTAVEVLTMLQSQSGATDVRMLEFNTSQLEASVGTLGRRDADVELAGSYAAVKYLLGEVLGAHDGSSLRAIRLRADPESGGVRARATLAFRSAPLPPPASSLVGGSSCEQRCAGR